MERAIETLAFDRREGCTIASFYEDLTVPL